MDFAHRIAAGLGVKPAQVASTLELLNEGCTIPFIARYRKERTGGLDEEQLRTVQAEHASLKALEDRRQVVLRSIEEQGKLTPNLAGRIAAADTLTLLEDLYLPFKPRRKTRADKAREAGLEPLARKILAQTREGPLPGDEELSGARDIVAETINEHPEVRALLRQRAHRFGRLASRKKRGAEDPRATYRTYYEFQAPVNRLRPHQVLALNRAEQEKILSVGLEVEERDWREAILAEFRPHSRSPWADQLRIASEDAASRLLIPSIERELRRELTETAEAHARQVFAENLRGLLMVPPLAGHTVLGVDPAYRTGCKLAVVDATGKVLETSTIYPHQPQDRWSEGLQTLEKLVRRHRVTLVAIGNGTASRETEKLAAELVERVPELAYLIVNEAGASVYSASPLARAELPDLDVSLRGAVSIARRVLDPLAELVKIDPRSVGVGMYQHDLDQNRLAETLDAVVESVVNQVGVDANTASPALLARVAGIGPKLAERIVEHRDAQGAFPSRQSFLKVKGLGPKAFEQAAGFLRLRDGREPLDATAIHPESYETARRALKAANTTLADPEREKKLRSLPPVADLARQWGCGVPTLQDILEQLVRPGRDPRADLPAPVLRQDVLKMEDLTPGMRLAGTVRNVVDFGAFVDIGVKQDGLVHRSQIPRHATLSVGEVVEVEVLSVDPARGRIGLGL